MGQRQYDLTKERLTSPYDCYPHVKASRGQEERISFDYSRKYKEVLSPRVSLPI